MRTNLQPQFFPKRLALLGAAGGPSPLHSFQTRNEGGPGLSQLGTGDATDLLKGGFPLSLTDKTAHRYNPGALVCAVDSVQSGKQEAMPTIPIERASMRAAEQVICDLPFV